MKLYYGINKVIILRVLISAIWGRGTEIELA